MLNVEVAFFNLFSGLGVKMCFKRILSALCFCFSFQAEQLMKRVGVEGVKLTEYEMNIASHLVDPQTMKVKVVVLHPWHWDYQVQDSFALFCNCSTFLQVSWRDIAGLDEVICELQDTVILPFQKRHLLAGSKLFQPPKGTTALHLHNSLKVKFYL